MAAEFALTVSQCREPRSETWLLCWTWNPTDLFLHCLLLGICWGKTVSEGKWTWCRQNWDSVCFAYRIFHFHGEHADAVASGSRWSLALRALMHDSFTVTRRFSPSSSLVDSASLGRGKGPETQPLLPEGQQRSSEFRKPSDASGITKSCSMGKINLVVYNLFCDPWWKPIWQAVTSSPGL